MYFKNLLILPLFLVLSGIFSQEYTTVKNNIEGHLMEYQEMAYAHLNKSTYVKGEQLAFTVYLLNKQNKKPFGKTQNLYCTITDQHNKMVKAKLVRVSGGIAYNVFLLDDTFCAGEYTFRAYTNHMRNFDEQNGYAQRFRILDVEIEPKPSTPSILSFELDVQFLPEGGHLLANVSNMVGVAIKDSLGFGVPNLAGTIKDSNGQVVGQFKVNTLGLGKFLFMPKSGTDYFAEIMLAKRRLRFPLEAAKPKGMNLQLNDLGKQVILTFNTNKQSLPIIQQSAFKLLIRNGLGLKELPVKFNHETELHIVIGYNDLFTGMNIFTLVDGKNTPVLERLFFNHKGVQILRSNGQTLKQRKDSVIVSLAYNSKDSTKFQNLSVSVLPKDTQAYKHHHSIVSYTHLQPYVKGFVEKARYYFEDVDKRKKYELDILLLTQGWSAYPWETWFNALSTKAQRFEKGIAIKATVEKQRDQRFLVHALNGKPPEVYTLSKQDSFFVIPHIFPKETDVIKISKLQGNGNLAPSRLRLSFNPKTIPEIDSETSILGAKTYQQTFKTSLKPFQLTSLTDTQVLDEVVVTGHVNKEQNTKLRGRVQGQIDFFDEDKNELPQFRTYLLTKGYRVVNNEIINPETKKPIAVYINDIRMWPDAAELAELYPLPMNSFEYIISNRSKPDFPIGSGTDVVMGVIKIKMRTPRPIKDDNRLRSTTYQVPLSFASPKKYYVPKYQNYKDDFFMTHGVLGWFPKNQLGKDGTLRIQFPHHNVSGVKLCIEGVTVQGNLISEVKNINFDYWR